MEKVKKSTMFDHYEDNFKKFNEQRKRVGAEVAVGTNEATDRKQDPSTKMTA